MNKLFLLAFLFLFGAAAFAEDCINDNVTPSGDEILNNIPAGLCPADYQSGNDRYYYVIIYEKYHCEKRVSYGYYKPTPPQPREDYREHGSRR